MTKNFNLGLKRDQVHAIRCQIRRLEINIAERNAQTDDDLLEIQRLERLLEDASHDAWLERIIMMCNTPCWRYRVM